MNWGRWITWGGLCLIILSIYICYKQDNMVVAWLSTEAKNPGETKWVFAKYSSGNVIGSVDIEKYAKSGWNSLGALWPVALALVVVTLTGGVAWGYIFSDNKYAESHKQELAKLTQKYEQRINDSYEKDARSASRDRETRKRIYAAKELEEYNQQLIECTAAEVNELKARLTETENKLVHLQEDHKNRGAKIERLEKGIVERIDKLEKVITGLNNATIEEKDKTILTLGEENLALIKAQFRFEAGPRKKEK